MASPRLRALITSALLLSAVAVFSEEITAQHASPPAICRVPCSAGQTCSCTCQWKSRHRAASTSTSGQNWLDIGATCQVQRSWQTGRCRPGSRCTCTCSPAPPLDPVAVPDVFLFEDPEGPDGPGTWPVSVLHNDVSPDGTPLTIAADSVQVLPTSTAGVSVVSVDAQEGIIILDIPDGAETVEVEYAVQSAAGRVSQKTTVQGTKGKSQVPNDYPKGVCSTKCGRPANLCQNTLNRQCSAPGTCPCLSWKSSSAFVSSNPYAMYDFTQACDKTQHVGCDRCAIYHIMKQCAANKPAPDCVVNDATNKMVIVKARDAKNNQLCLMNKHYLIMPHTPCTGVDDPNSACRGSFVLAWWQKGFRFATSSSQGFSKPAIMINQPEERGQHHMHIHIAEILASGPFGLLPTDLSTLPKFVAGSSTKPKQFTNGNKQLLAFYVTKSDFPNLSPTHAAKQIHYQHYPNNYNDYSYGVAVVPEKDKNGKFTGGAALITVYGFSDRNSLDISIGSSCQAPCKPITDYP